MRTFPKDSASKEPVELSLLSKDEELGMVVLPLKVSNSKTPKAPGLTGGW